MNSYLLRVGGLGLFSLVSIVLTELIKEHYFVYKNNSMVMHNLKIIYPHMNSIGFDSIIGYKEIKNILSRNIKSFKKKEKLNGILFYGPPGNGKTNFVLGLSKEAGVPVILIDVNNLKTEPKYLLKNIQTVFKKAQELSPCILFIDEIDLLLKNRAYMRLSDSQESMLTLFLQRLDGLHSNENKGILVVGCTNNIDFIDSAIIRHGRLGKKIYIDSPTEKDIEELFEKKFRQYFMFKDLFAKNRVAQKMHQHKIPVVSVLEYIKDLNEELDEDHQLREKLTGYDNKNEDKVESIIINLNKEFGIN
jgi:SpoVK/Ycf46/Vps4 family AAA+-type ATPase